MSTPQTFASSLESSSAFFCIQSTTKSAYVHYSHASMQLSSEKMAQYYKTNNSENTMVTFKYLKYRGHWRVCPVVNFKAPKLVEVNVSSLKHPVIYQTMEKSDKHTCSNEINNVQNYIKFDPRFNYTVYRLSKKKFNNLFQKLIYSQLLRETSAGNKLFTNKINPNRSSVFWMIRI